MESAWTIEAFKGVNILHSRIMLKVRWMMLWCFILAPLILMLCWIYLILHAKWFFKQLQPKI